MTAEMLLDKPMVLADGAQDELETVVRCHARRVYQVAYSVLRNREDAEDVAQEAFLRLLKQRHKLREVREPRAWLARTAWRLAVSRRRRPPDTPLDDAALLALRDSSLDAEELAASQQMSRLLDHLIATLPRPLRDVVTLSAAAEMTSAEIGAVLGIPEGSVRNRLLRARQLLRAKLEAVWAGKRP